MTGQRAAAVAADLRERIALGDVDPAGALESEAALGQRHGVSRVTVRRALELLRSEGLVESRRGAGWFVAGASVHQPLAVGTFRHAGSALADAGLRASRRVVEFGFRPAADRVAASLQLGEGDDVLHVRSVRSVDGVPLDVAHEWVPGALGAEVSRSDAQEPGTWTTLQAHGVRIDRVRQTVTAAVATGEDADLLGVAAGSALLLVRRVAHDASGAPVALADHRYLASRFSLEVEFAGWSTAGAGEPPGLRDSAADGRTTTTTATAAATRTAATPTDEETS
ncbi:MAG TPA: GntR family transcriptional regulator [Actinomycetes bacterium]|nr:GntR family transcriptional regulator [Actinomycetes bacterium]